MMPITKYNAFKCRGVHLRNRVFTGEHCRLPSKMIFTLDLQAQSEANFVWREVDIDTERPVCRGDHSRAVILDANLMRTSPASS